MNPNFRKVALGAATLGLLLSLFIALRPDDAEPTKPPPATTAAGTAPSVRPAPAVTTAKTTTTTPAPSDVVTIRIAVEGGRPVGGIRRGSVREGREVVVLITADIADEAHLHGYDVSGPVAPGKTSRLAFSADVPGRFELELEQRGVVLAEIEVRP